jgi:hypothetical protein
MPSLNPPLTKDDFINSRWQDVINSGEKKDCLTYNNALWKKAEEAKEAGNVREQAVLEILAFITGAAIKPESTEEFFADIFQNLTDEHLDFLAAIAPDISDPELQARVADILWVRRSDYRMAQLAVTAYLKSATELENTKNWNQCFKRIERALRLARRIKHHSEVVVTHIETFLDSGTGDAPLWLLAKLMELLQEYRLSDPTKYAPLAEKAAILAESAHDWDRARAYWEIKAKWHLIEKDGEKERSAWMLAAETYVKEAEDALKRTPLSYLVASHFIQRAVEAFRSIRGTKEETTAARVRAEEVYRVLLQYQEESQKQPVTSSYEINISGLVEQAKAHVRGKNSHDALFALASLSTPSKVSHLRQEVQKLAHDYPLTYLIPEVILNEIGKTVAQRSTSVLSRDPSEVAEATRFEMYKDAVLYQSLHAQTFIEPARVQINSEYSVQVNDLLSIATDSPFVPPERENLFAKGLYAGLSGDFFTSTHILIPQIENSVRYLLWKQGFIALGLDDRETQNEHNLNVTLYHPDITFIFDEDTLFDLRGLLVEPSGSNLRNRMVHGLISDNGFLSPLMSYLWWLALRLCCLPILIHQQKVEQSDPWVKFAGMFKDDPLFDDFVEDMAAYRRELDAEVAADEVTPGENHPE